MEKSDENANKKPVKLYLAAWSWLVLMTGAVYLLTESLWYSAWMMAGCSVFCLLLYAQNQYNRQYVRGLVIQLDALLDNLLLAEKNSVFPENKDDLTSKLQNKIFRLSGILQKQKEQEEREHQKVKSLVSDLSHQLKTPIANLKMYGELLEDETLSYKDRKMYMQILKETIEKLQFLTEGLIKMSRLESGILTVCMQQEPLSGTLLRALKSVYGMAKKKNVELLYEPEQEIMLCHDPKWTGEAVYNLLDNAVKYGNSGQKVVLQTKQYGMFVEIMVKDTNPPIAREEQNLIFQRFYRGQQQREKEGIGLGLYLAKEIVEKQGGYMRLKVDKTGNCFSIVLPMKEKKKEDANIICNDVK